MADKNEIHDPLTGLLNRKEFDEALKAAILYAQRTDHPLSLAFLDIDHFKRINDSLGHAAGDIVIRAIANAIKSLAGETASVYRYGGEEFIIIFPDTAREQAFLVVENIRGEIARMEKLTDGSQEVDTRATISGGISAYPIDGQDEGELWRKADQALYKAKVGGRNKVLLAYEEKMAPKTSHYTLTQLERLSELAREQGVGEAVLLREALDDLLSKYKHSFAHRK